MFPYLKGSMGTFIAKNLLYYLVPKGLLLWVMPGLINEFMYMNFNLIIIIRLFPPRNPVFITSLLYLYMITFISLKMLVSLLILGKAK